MNRRWIVSAPLVVVFVFATNAEAKDKTRPKNASPPTASKETEKNEPTVAPGERGSKNSNDIGEIIDKLDYPELQVVPRASERLRMEAQDERGSWFYTHWQMELSGLATAYTGTIGKNQLRSDLNTKEKADAGKIMMGGQALGVAWLSAGVLIGLQRPYRSGLSAIAKYEGRGTRGLIMRERLAEEALERPARLMRPLQWISAISNFSMNVVMASYVNDETKITAGISAILAFLPLIYEDHAIRTHEKHLEYKSKIYGPIGSAAPIYDPQTRTWHPGASLTWAF